MRPNKQWKIITWKKRRSMMINNNPWTWSVLPGNALLQSEFAWLQPNFLFSTPPPFALASPKSLIRHFSVALPKNRTFIFKFLNVSSYISPLPALLSQKNLLNLLHNSPASSSQWSCSTSPLRLYYFPKTSHLSLFLYAVQILFHSPSPNISFFQFSISLFLSSHFHLWCSCQVDCIIWRRWSASKWSCMAMQMWDPERT